MRSAGTQKTEEIHHQQSADNHAERQLIGGMRFSEDMPIEVICEKGKLTIIPHDPDPIPEPVQKANDLIRSLTPNQRWILKKSLQENSR